MYPIKMGELRNGIICWVQKGNDETEGILRVRSA
jgi:hypothetical protein